MATWVATPVVLDGKTGPTGPGGSGSGAGGSVMVAAGFTDGYINQLVRSTDRGISWSAAGVTGTTGTYGTSVAYNGIYWIAASDHSQEVLKSEDGLVWTAVEVLNFPDSIINTIKWNGKQFLAGVTEIGLTGPYLFESANGLAWTGGAVSGITGTSPGIDGIIYDIASDGHRWVGVLGHCVSEDTGLPMIQSTDNGKTWTGVGITGTAGFFESGYGIVYSDGVWVAVGLSTTDSATTIMRSVDGLTWTRVGGGTVTTDFGLGPTGSGNGVSSNGIHLVAVGGGNSTHPTILVSTDKGLTWDSTGVTGDINTPSAADVYFNSVKWNGERWVAIGTTPNSLVYSTDGYTWVGATGDVPGIIGAEIASNYLHDILYGNDSLVGGAGSVGPTGARGTVIFYGYGVPEGISGYVGPTGPTGYGPTGDAFGPQKTGDFYLNFEDGRLYLTP